MEMKDLQEEMRKLQEEAQNEYIDKLLDIVENLCEKANKNNYEPTEHEREMFGKIVTIITNMSKWFQVNA